MSRIRLVFMYLVLVVILLLIACSIYGSFIGAGRARQFFNSTPLGVYWFVFMIVLIAGGVLFRTLLRRPALLMIHLGCLLVITGGLWGWAAGHGFGRGVFGRGKIVSGKMPLFVGNEENRVRLDDPGQKDSPEGGLSSREDNRQTDQPPRRTPQVRQLPFMVKLVEFRTLWYEPGDLYIYTQEGRPVKIPARADATAKIGLDMGRVSVVRTYENCKVSLEGGKIVAYEGTAKPLNPAVEVIVQYPNGSQRTRYIFEKFPDRMMPSDKFVLRYQRTVRDWVSRVQVIDDGRVVAEKDIEVNKPLYYGGYHFYQNAYDPEKDDFSVLGVVSSSGLYPVFVGYSLIIAGLFWQLWIKMLFASASRDSTARPIEMPVPIGPEQMAGPGHGVQMDTGKGDSAGVVYGD